MLFRVVLPHFNTDNPPLIDESLIGLLSNPPVPPFEVDHHCSSCCLSSFNQSMRAMLTLVFVFMLFNLTTIWNLSTTSTGEHGHDGILCLDGPAPRFFVRARPQKAVPARHPPIEAVAHNSMP